ncbi:FlgD immunoglobulin-like domain containing protein [Lutimonas sp.]|uniref:FlgD immunoglobulin-like domain containing protein n=1 Tax=Lutimonas sp. TaxID=1872403 RepID=UPI003C780FD3
MDKITFQKFIYFINRSLTNLFSSRNVFGKLFLTVLIFVFSSNGIPDWKGNKNKSLENWKWEIVKKNESIPLPPPFGPPTPPPNDNWYQRAGLQALNHKGKFFIFGGRTPLPIPIPGASILHGDVWSSSDKGKSWKQELASNPTIPGVIPDPNATLHWANRAYFQAVKKGSFMYIIGGQDFTLVTVPNEDFPDDCSDDPIFPGGPIPPCEPTIQVPVSQFFNDVWRSRDGVNWRQMVQNQVIDLEDDNPPHWAGRAGLSAVVFKGYIYVMGGSVNDDAAIVGGAPARKYFNDVWRSRDGRRWERVKKDMKIFPGDKSHWAQRAGGIAVVKGGYMYMIGGEEGFTCLPEIPGVPAAPCPPYFNDVWRTKDGVNWEEMTEEADWDKRPGHQVVVAQNQLVLFGGFGLGNDNGATPSNPSDVWVSNNGSKWEKVSDAPWNADGSEDIKYDFDAFVEKGYGKFSDAIYTFGGDRETFDFSGSSPDNYKQVDNDVWKFSLPKKQEEETVPELIFTLKNYPNPFSETTTLSYVLPDKSYVTILIFDRNGRFVKRLVGKNQEAGAYEVQWNGENYKGRNVRKGYYYASIWSQGKAKTIKMLKN